MNKQQECIQECITLMCRETDNYPTSGHWSCKCPCHKPTPTSWEESLKNIVARGRSESAPYQYTQLRDLITQELEREREKGFMQGFNDCKKMVEHGEHAHCCIIPGKKLEELKGS